MTMLESLKFTDKTRDAGTSPEGRLRQKLLAAIDLQISAAQAEADGEEFVRQAMRWITDTDTGETVRQEVPVRMRRWWWNDDTGNVMMEVRYGNKPLELQPGKPTIEIGEQDNLLPVLSTLRQGIVAGELDKLLMDAKKARPRPKRKGARS